MRKEEEGSEEEGDVRREESMGSREEVEERGDEE